MSKWEEKRLEDIIDVNPPVKLKKGKSYPFIDIDKVSPTRRSVTNEEVKVYDGQSSSKFCDGDTVFPASHLAWKIERLPKYLLMVMLHLAQRSSMFSEQKGRRLMHDSPIILLPVMQLCCRQSTA